MYLRRKPIFFLFLLLHPVFINAQFFADRLKSFMSTAAVSAVQYPKEVKEFYELNSYRFSWLEKQNAEQLALLSDYIRSSPSLGLSAGDYHPEIFPIAAIHENDSLLTEISFTDAAIHFLHDLMMGNKAEPLSYDGLKYVPACYNAAALLNVYLSPGRFANLLTDLEPKEAGYLAVKTKLNAWLKITSAEKYNDAVVAGSKTLRGNKNGLTRLYQLGFVASDTASLSEPALKAALKEAQKMFSLLSDGELRSTTVQALNVPLATRIAELKNTLNTLRWLHCVKQERHVALVNIPSATLLLYEHGKLVIESRIIVGKKSTPTPTLSSTITEVILYPYWNVPYKIATRELLPAIKRNTGYINANNYQVLNSSGKVVDPYKVNWRSLSAGNFPYTIRQSTGCDNALGLVKLNFYNPFSVYLHDTPGKSLFGLDRRYFSHGCMRLEKAMELGRYVLTGNAVAIDTLTEKGCLKNQSPITVPATEKIPVFVLYHTAWIDGTGMLHFYEDVYNRFSPGRKP